MSKQRTKVGSSASLLVSLTLGTTLIISGTLAAHAYSGENLAKDAKVTLSEARAIALKISPGKITDEELEQEDGSLRYSFDIKVAKVMHEVGVDAQTGKVLENSVEGSNPD